MYVLICFQESATGDERIAPTLGTNLEISVQVPVICQCYVSGGWQVEAVEKSPSVCVHFTKEHFNLDVKAKRLLLDFPDASFDVITLWHVMEHLQNLQNTWERLSDLLSERGMLVVAVPTRFL